LVRGLRDDKSVARRSINRHANGAKREHARIINGGKIAPPYLRESIVPAHEKTIGNKQTDVVKNTQMRHTRIIELAKLGTQERTIAATTTNQATAVSRHARGKARPIVAL
jgi:hypothetical protein